MKVDFADLLDQHMRRIRASASSVAIEIGMSREAVNNWRRGYSKPSKKHRDKVIACSSYLRLSEAECNDLLSSVGFNDEYALFENHQSVNYSDLFDQLEQAKPYPILLVLSQAHIDQPPQKQVILEMAQAKYPQSQVMHFQMPFASNIEAPVFFKYMGAQLNLTDVDNELSFEFKFSDLLQKQAVTLVITRFEHGNQACREMMAGILRNLCEMYTGQLQLILCGSEGLSALKYAQGNLSLLNIATSHLLTFDLNSWLAGQSSLAEKKTSKEWMFSLVGNHPALASSVYQAIQSNKTNHELSDLLSNNDLLYCDFNQVTQVSGREKLSDLLELENLGRYRPYLQDVTLRKLFWLNLIRKENNHLIWQSEPIRNFGKKMMKELLG